MAVLGFAAQLLGQPLLRRWDSGSIVPSEDALWNDVGAKNLPPNIKFCVLARCVARRLAVNVSFMVPGEDSAGWLLMAKISTTTSVVASPAKMRSENRLVYYPALRRRSLRS